MVDLERGCAVGGCAWQRALCRQRRGAKSVETESAECTDVQVEKWAGPGGPGWREARSWAGVQRVLKIRMNNLGSELKENVSAQS